mmetsp:Transcript_7188/g.19536  ORF Transcript_7188/g.19536 Transcript_7188/m.19536 type:complete len:441 (+) Transcript_7188:674-1996(+)
MRRERAAGCGGRRGVDRPSAAWARRLQVARATVHVSAMRPECSAPLASASVYACGHIAVLVRCAVRVYAVALVRDGIVLGEPVLAVARAVGGLGLARVIHAHVRAPSLAVPDHAELVRLCRRCIGRAALLCLGAMRGVVVLLLVRLVVVGGRQVRQAHMLLHTASRTPGRNSLVVVGARVHRPASAGGLLRRADDGRELLVGVPHLVGARLLPPRQRRIHARVVCRVFIAGTPRGGALAALLLRAAAAAPRGDAISKILCGKTGTAGCHRARPGCLEYVGRAWPLGRGGGLGGGSCAGAPALVVVVVAPALPLGVGAIGVEGRLIARGGQVLLHVAKLARHVDGGHDARLVVEVGDAVTLVNCGQRVHVPPHQGVGEELLNGGALLLFDNEELGHECVHVLRVGGRDGLVPAAHHLAREAVHGVGVEGGLVGEELVEQAP